MDRGKFIEKEEEDDEEEKRKDGHGGIVNHRNN